MFRVFLEGIELNGKHGVLEEERRIGNRFLIDVTMSVNGVADTTDNLSDTIDYAQVVSLIHRVSESRSFFTVEALAGAMADAILDFDLRLTEVWIRLAKIHPPVDANLKSAGAEVTRKR